MFWKMLVHLIGKIKLKMVHYPLNLMKKKDFQQD